ncbi:hypothetical protein ACFCT7_08890 [Fulvivirgaceae bacterium LMO-SS25]
MRFLILFFLVSFNCSGQKQMNEMQCLEELHDCLFEFLIAESQAFNEEEKSILFLVDLSENDRDNLLKTKGFINPGVYSFGLSGPHFNNYIVVVTSEEAIIVENYNIENVLIVLNDFFKRSEKNISEVSKLSIVMNVLEILNVRLENEKLEREELDIELDK